MRICSVHNRYQERGGEDAVFEAEAELLSSYGHEVTRVEVHNRDIDVGTSLLSRAQLAASTIWSRTGQDLVAAAVRRSGADIVHFHNTFPLISPAAYAACQRLGVPVVQTLHNYRLLCPNVLFFRDGKPCEDCLGKTVPYPAAIHGCYRGSRAESSVVAAMLTAHRLRGTWRRDVDRYIVMTDFAKRKFVEGGLPEHLVSIKPHFMQRDPGGTSSVGDAMMFVGRLVDYKGVPLLPDAWSRLEADVPLRIVGDGPLTRHVEQFAGRDDRVAYLGRQAKEAVLDEMQAARAVLVPSVLYETFGLTIIEAFACGTPVIASRLGVMADAIDHGRTGLLFDPGNAEDLADKVRWAWEHPEEMRRMGDAARREFEAKYTAERNYRMLMDIYEQAIKRARRRRIYGTITT